MVKQALENTRDRLTPKGYLSRLVDGEVESLLEIFGAVEINGPKWCGKTWTALNHSCSEIHLDDEAMRDLVGTDIHVALVGEKPHLIDEWQRVPAVRDAVRRAVDESGNEAGSYLLTGSATPAYNKVAHSGAGRIASLRMRPLSFAESGISNASISLYGLFNGEFEEQMIDTNIAQFAEAICRGGWPASIARPIAGALRIPRQYINTVFEVTAQRMGKDPQIARRALVALARNNGEAASYATLARDMSAGEYEVNPETARNRAEEYTLFYQHLFMIEDLPGWDAPVKSRARVRTRPKRYLVDPSLATAALGFAPERLLGEMQMMGRLFETLCIRDIRTYLSARPETADASLFYYRDDYGLEVDAIIELVDGRWAAIEIKLSEDKVQKGIESLLRLKNKVKENPAAQNREPEFLAVLVGRTSIARKTPEGVYVVPVTCLTA